MGERLAAACESAAVYFEQCLVNAPYGELARDALSERGISEEVTTRFRLGYAPARWDGLAEHLKAQRVSPADAELAGLTMSDPTYLLASHGGALARCSAWSQYS